MNPSIITIVTLGIVSILVVGLMVFCYCQIIKSTKALSKSGLLDEEYKQENTHKKNKYLNILINAFSITITVSLLSLCLVGVYYRISGEQFSINNQTAFVIASNSMENCISQEYETILRENVKEYLDTDDEGATNYIVNSEFNVGDMLTFTRLDKEEELELYTVYGYKNNKNQIIVHRLVGKQNNKYVFRGDNTPGNDTLVSRDQILYRYNNSRILVIGYFVLFASSSFGVYSLFIVLLIFVMGDITKHQYEKIKKNRLYILENKGYEA